MPAALANVNFKRLVEEFDDARMHFDHADTNAISTVATSTADLTPSKGADMRAPDPARPVLVTGGAGFAGSYVVRGLLDAGFDVVVFDLNDFRPEARFTIGPDADRIPLERGSIDYWPRVLEVVGRYRPGGIVHAGGHMDIPFLDRNPMSALNTNVVGAVNLLEAARLHDVRRFVFFSSIGVIPHVEYEPIDGDHPVILTNHGPAWAYSTAKLCGELFCYTYLRSFGLDFRIIRPSAVYGFGMSWSAPNFMKQIVEPAVNGQPVRMASGGQSPRDYIHAVDLASLVVAVLDGPDDADRIFYGATGEPLTIGSEVGRIVKGLIPDAAIDISDAWTEDDRLELCCRGVTSIDNAKSQLGWSPSYVPLEKGVADYIERYRSFLATERGS